MSSPPGPEDGTADPRGTAASAAVPVTGRTEGHSGGPGGRQDRGAGRGRIEGLDAARALAVVGMVMVHFGPFPLSGDDLATVAYRSTHGRASILFVVLAGIGVSLLAGDRSTPRLRSTWLRLGYRAAVLLPLGLVLQPLDHGVLVILQYYAVYFLVAGAVVALGDRAVLGVAVALAVLGPVVHLGAQMAFPGWFEAASTGTITDRPAQIARDLLLTGSYPVVVWSAPVLFGVWLGRRDLRAPAVRAWLVGGGVAAAALVYGMSLSLEAWLGPPAEEPAWGQLVLGEAHSQMPAWLIGATAVATTVVGLTLALADRLPRLLWPLTATGQLAFTVYVGHLLVLAWAPQLLTRETVAGAAVSVARFALITAVLAMAWRAAFGRGPLELVLRLPWTVAAGRVRTSASDPTPR